MTIIRLKSKDGIIMETEEEIVKCSGLISRMLESCAAKEGQDAIIPLENVRTAILRKILVWAEHHKNDPVPKDSKITEGTYTHREIKSLQPWDAEFLKVDQPTLFGLIDAANYMDIKGLFDLGCMHVASMMVNKFPETIRETFRIKNNLPIEAKKLCEKK